VIVITHSIPEIMRLATRIMILRLGRVVQMFDKAALGADAGDAIVSAITGAKVELGAAR
jgi:ABC-type uncharacterized transport system ATPase subunit